MSTEVVIVAATRTAVGKFGGTLSRTPAPELGAAVVIELLRRARLNGDQIDELIFGQVLTAGSGQNPARQTVIKGGLPQSVPAMTINAVCGSGLKAVMLGAQAIRDGDSKIVIAGGQESMSMAPHLLPGSRDGQRMGDWKLVDSMIVDGLLDVYNKYHMGITAENVAKKYEISREKQDMLALHSQQKAAAAQEAGRFKDEIVPFSIAQKKGDPIIFASDEFINKKTNAEALAGLRPAFDKDGTVTAGNASGLNDGAAGVVLMTAQNAAQLDLKPLARIASYATVALDPSIMGMGPVPASKKALQRAGWKPQDLDLLEINEAFAAQACAVNNEMGWDTSKVNVNGGAIAIGHPIGASGCRILVTLLHEMIRRDAKKGLASLCIGGGMGVALAVERSVEGSKTRHINTSSEHYMATTKRIALVTGGMGGLGEAICIKLAKLGDTVATTYSPTNMKSQEWLTSMKEQGYQFYAYPCDVTDWDSCQACIRKVSEDLGPVDVLVNNAGVTRDMTFKKMDKSNWDAVMHANLDSCFNMTKQVCDGMMDRGWGRVINISSVNGQKGALGQTNYSAAKAGMHGFTKALALEVVRKGVTVNTISPGYIGTKMVMAIPKEVLDSKIIPQIPMGRLGKPEEVAGLVAYLASEEAAFVTGANIAINGGQHMQ